MIHYISLLVLAFAVSVDSFGVGITYGMRKVLIPTRSICIIAFCSGFMILLAMAVGQGIIYVLTPHVAEVLGGIILLMIGLWALYNITRSREAQEIEKMNIEQPQDEKQVWTLEIKKLGIVIQILRKPMVADIDRSGVISGIEAFLLGVALALDAFGAGIGAALMGYSPWLTAILIASMSSLFIFLGMKMGERFSEAAWLKGASFIPAFILILFGLFRLI